MQSQPRGKPLFDGSDFDETRFRADMERPAAARSFGIFFTPRSGSTWLADVLERTGRLGRPQEWFHPKFLAAAARDLNARDLDGYIEMLRRKRSLGDTFSFELTIYQMRRVFGGGPRFLSRFGRDLPLFYLTREDPVLQAVSLAKAVRTSVFHSAGASPERLARAEAEFTYDGDEIARWFDHILDQEQRCEGFFLRNGLRPVRLSYETITAAGEAATARRILETVLPAEAAAPALPDEPASDTAGDLASDLAGGESAYRKLGAAQNADYAARFRAEWPDRVAEAERVRHPPAPPRRAGTRRKPVLYLHIGAHKTATTTIQGSFWRKRDLLARHGLLYPATNRYHYAQHRLAFALKGQRDPARGDRPDLAEEVAALREAMETAAPMRRTFVSSEGLFATPERRLRELRAALDFAEVRVIAVVRRQDDYLLSLYNQNTMQLGNSFTRPLRDHVDNPRGIAREISFLHWLETWRTVFGADAVRLLRYEDRDPLGGMLECLDLPGTLIAAPCRANTSAPAAAAEAVRLAKRMNLPRPLQSAVFSVAVRLFAGGRMQRLSEADRRRIMTEFAAENEAMFAAFGMENTYAPAPEAGTA